MWFHHELYGQGYKTARSAVASQITGLWEELRNPCRGAENKVNTTFGGQSTFVLPVEGKKDAFIFMADQWNPENAIDGSQSGARLVSGVAASNFAIR